VALKSIDPRADGERYLLVRAGPNRYAIPTRVIRSVVQMPDLHGVPGAHPCLIGLGQYGGEPLAVVDVESLERGAETIGGSRMIMVVIAPSEDLLIGIAADEAEKVSRLRGNGVAEEGRRDVPITEADGDGVKRLLPSWFLDRVEDLQEGRDR
jgi:chemotaxis signal transduction protein